MGVLGSNYYISNGTIEVLKEIRDELRGIRNTMENRTQSNDGNTQTTDEKIKELSSQMSALQEHLNIKFDSTVRVVDKGGEKNKRPMGFSTRKEEK